MSPSITLFIFLLFNSLTLFSQDYKDKFSDPNVNVFELEKAFFEYWNDERQALDDSEFKHYSRLLQRMKKRTNIKGKLGKPMSYNEMKELDKRNRQQHVGLTNAWRQIGPKGTPPRPNSSFSGVGRMTSIAWTPLAPQRLLAGASSGGFWISEDMGESWFSSTDRLTNLSIFNIEVDPQDPEVIYAATGDRWSDAVPFGLIKSIDGGISWNVTALVSNVSQDYGYVWSSLVDKENSQIINAATSQGGVQRSIDGGASWIQTTTYRFRHMIHHPQNPDIIYAATGYNNGSEQDNTHGVFYSPDKGLTWIKTFESTFPHFNVKLDVIPTEPSNVYLLAAHHVSGDNVLYKSEDNGITFDSLSELTSTVLSTQKNINWTLSVDPASPNDIYVGSVNMAKSSDGGLTWSRILCQNPVTCVHVDYHQTKFFGSELFMATDGGVYSTDDQGQTWQNHSQGLETSQYYRHTNSQSNPDFILGGAQDNGTHRYDQGWTTIFGGDGMDNLIDPTNNDFIYYSYQSGRLYRSVDRGNTAIQMLSSTTTGVNGTWTTPMAMDPTNSSVLYAGYNKLWKSTDKGVSWTDNGNASLCSSNSCLYHIDVAKSNPDYVYFSKFNQLYRSTDGGITNELRSSLSINWIEVDPADENHLWVVSYRSIKESFDGGLTWIDITANLPTGLDFTTIVYDEGTNGHIYIGSDQGIYFKDNTMTDWLSFSNLLPNVEITELEILENFNIIRASTYGRGIWESFTVEQQSCLDTITVSGVITPGTYHASKRLESNAIQNTQTDVIFKAGEEIELQEFFEVKEGTNFQAYIENCASYQLTPLPLGYKCDSSFGLGQNESLTSIGPAKGNGGTQDFKHAVWYSFSVPADGKINVNSCGGNYTNLKVWSGSCESKVLIGESRLDCFNPTIGSKFEDLLVNAGDEIFLEWDSTFRVDSFDFQFEFIAN